MPMEPKWLSKGKALTAFRSAITAWYVRKNWKTLYTAFNNQRKKRRNRTKQEDQESVIRGLGRTNQTTSHSRHPVQSSSTTAFHSKSLRRTDISSRIRSNGSQQFWQSPRLLRKTCRNRHLRIQHCKANQAISSH